MLILEPSPLPQSIYDSPEQELFLSLWKTYDCLKALEEQLFAHYELSAQQYNVLRILKRVYPDSIPTLKLAQKLISRSPDITRMLDRLDKRQLIERERQLENRRVVQVTLTPQGDQLLQEMAAAVKQMHHDQLGHLSSEQQARLLDLLKKARQPHESSGC